MRKTLFLITIIMASLGCPSCGPDKQQPATVYMTTEITPESLIRMYEILGVPAEGRVAVKISSGEPGGHDQACVDLVFNYEDKESDSAEALKERITSRHGIHTVEHAEKIGLGTRKYKLVKL